MYRDGKSVSIEDVVLCIGADGIVFVQVDRWKDWQAF